MLTPVEGMRRAVTLGQSTDPAERARLGQVADDGEDPRVQAGRQKGARVQNRAPALAKAPANVLFLSLTSVTTTFTDERKQSCNWE